MSKNWQILLLSGLALIIRSAKRGSFGMDPEKQVEGVGDEVFHTKYVKIPPRGVGMGSSLSQMSWALSHTIFTSLNPSLTWILMNKSEQKMPEQKNLTMNFILCPSFGMTWSVQKYQEKEYLCNKPHMCPVRLSLNIFKLLMDPQISWKRSLSGRGHYGQK